MSRDRPSALSTLSLLYQASESVEMKPLKSTQLCDFLWFSVTLVLTSGGSSFLGVDSSSCWIIAFLIVLSYTRLMAEVALVLRAVVD